MAFKDRHPFSNDWEKARKREDFGEQDLQIPGKEYPIEEMVHFSPQSEFIRKKPFNSCSKPTRPPSPEMFADTWKLRSLRLALEDGTLTSPSCFPLTDSTFADEAYQRAVTAFGEVCRAYKDLASHSNTDVTEGLLALSQARQAVERAYNLARKREHKFDIYSFIRDKGRTNSFLK